MYILLVFAFLPVPRTLLGQEQSKKDYIGNYSNNNLQGDTVSGYFFFSLDSFKSIYTINIDDSKDMGAPMGAGTWTIHGNEVELRYDNGVIKKARISVTHIEGDFMGPVHILYLENKSFSNISEVIKKSAQ